MLAEQHELDFTRYPERAGFKERDTSKAAADAIEDSGRAPLLRDRVLELYQAGRTLTADEAAHALRENILSVRPRVTELVKQGKLADTGTRRPNAGGRLAKVYRIKREEH